MSYKILKKVNFNKIFKSATAGLALFLTVFISSYFLNSTKSLAVEYLGLPACSGALNQHRINCANLVDLPLCSDVIDEGVTGANPGVNCVRQCNDENVIDENPNPPLPPAADNPDTPEDESIQDSQVERIRGIDYAIHDEHCIRFCDNLDSPETDFLQTLNPSITGVLNPIKPINCIKRKCHQLPSGVLANPGVNCEMMKCNLLTANELQNPRFEYDNIDYDPEEVEDGLSQNPPIPAPPPPPLFCDGKDVKCYDFSQEKLPFIKIWSINSMCSIHNCKPSSSNCPIPDDTLNITSNPSVLNGKTYAQDYVTHINAGQSLESNIVCKPVECKPITKRPYTCIGGNLDERNPSCDSTGEGSVCENEYCYKTVDCNKSENSGALECISPNDSDYVSDAEVAATDTMESWFYRPAPMNKATYINSQNQRVIRNMSPRMCYTKSQLKSFSGETLSFLGYFHTQYSPDWPQSPGYCGSKYGIKGTGYLYLCGTNNNIFQGVDKDQVLYHKGRIVSSYSHGEAVHKLTVCTRFYNSSYVNTQGETCGTRECAIAMAFGRLFGQMCGNDVCRTLTIKDSAEKECDNSKTNNLFNGHDTSKGCMARLGNEGMANGYLRVRAVKYGNRICTFLDATGVRGRSALNGTQRLSDGTCLFGEEDQNGLCSNGQDSTDYPSSLTKWRTFAKGHYIDDNQPDPEINGYLDRLGRLHKALECPKVRPRISPGAMPNIANAINSARLFMPPIFISKAFVRRGGGASPIIGDDLGSTDFNFPEIEVTFGSIKKKLSLGMNYTGSEGADERDPNSFAKLELTTAENIEFKAAVFVRKDLIRENNSPKFCLYQELTDQNGLVLAPVRIGCVARNYPEINDPEDKKQGLVISQEFIENSLNNTKLTLKYSDFGQNLLNNNCSEDDVCSSTISFFAPEASKFYCNSQVANYNICVKRDECTKLRVECLENEINLQKASRDNLPTESYLRYRNYCNNQLLRSCYERKGLTMPQGSSITQNDPFLIEGPENSYGIFPEICVASGFQTKIKTIIAYKMSKNILGKCIIDEARKTASNCDAGGNARIGCPCLEYESEVHVLNSNEEVRQETQREAGLCIDMTEPGSCPAISYGSDPDINASLGQLNYSDSAGTSGVHSSHANRTLAQEYGHAQFPKAVPGMNKVEGLCTGFWRYSGSSRKPKLNCIKPQSASEDPYWSALENPCVRYSCPQVSTAGPDIRGNYQGSYSSGETGDDVGKSHGFAIWPAYTKTNDFMETVDASKYNDPNAIRCIPGFKKVGSTPRINQTTGKIEGYDGGTSPVRQCNQLGQYLEPTVKCKRITCPAINPPNPESFAQRSDAWWDAWAQWNKSRGASFPSSKASRSTRIQPQQESPIPESVVEGTCNEDLGFLQIIGAKPPSISCDHLGNWREVTNPCVTKCKEVNSSSNPPANDPSNGFAYWAEVTDVSLHEGQKDAEFLGCIEGYVPYPYPPIRDKSGSELEESVANDLSRPATNPERLCKSVSTAGGQANTWTLPSSSCINKCPGADTDPRIGVGITRHAVSYGSKIEEIRWQDTTLGTTATISGPQGNSSCGKVEANHFFKGRTNQCYVVRRHCGLDGKWSDTEPSCVARYDAQKSDGSSHPGGELENATYDTGATPGFENSLPAMIDIDPSQPSALGTCTHGYWESDSQPSSRGTSKPKRQCVFEDSNQYIDKVYWKLINGNCKEVSCAPPEGGVLSVEAGSITFAIDSAKNFSDEIEGSCSSSELLFGSNPTISCQADGEWSAVENVSSCKRGCTIPYYQMEVDPKDCGNKEPVYGIDQMTLAHNQQIQFVINKACGTGTDDCDGWRFAAKCNDGTPIISSLYLGGNAIPGTGNESGTQCPYTVFDFDTQQWAPVVSSDFQSQVLRFPAGSNEDRLIDASGNPFTANIRCVGRCGNIVGRYLMTYQSPRALLAP